eukprot:2580033-Rhodomonas_salina.1
MQSMVPVHPASQARVRYRNQKHPAAFPRRRDGERERGREGEREGGDQVSRSLRFDSRLLCTRDPI